MHLLISAASLPVLLAAIHAHARTEPEPFWKMRWCFWVMRFLFLSCWYRLIFVTSIHKTLFLNISGFIFYVYVNCNAIFKEKWYCNYDIRMENGSNNNVITILKLLYLFWDDVQELESFGTCLRITRFLIFHCESSLYIQCYMRVNGTLKNTSGVFRMVRSTEYLYVL